MDLGEYLRLAAATPWAWGTADCSTFVADWIIEQTGMDPMAFWRGYCSEGEAECFIAEAGGLLPLFDEGISPIWPHVDTPVIGAAAVVTVIGEDREPIDVGAIYTGRRWALRSPRGICVVSLDPENVSAIWAR